MQNSEGSVEITALHKVIYRCDVGTRLLVPLTSPYVKTPCTRRIFSSQLGVQKFPEKLVVPVVGRVPSEGDDKENRV